MPNFPMLCLCHSCWHIPEFQGGSSKDTACFWADVIPQPELLWKLKFQPSEHLGTPISKTVSWLLWQFFFTEAQEKFKCRTSIGPSPKDKIQRESQHNFIFYLTPIPKELQWFSQIGTALFNRNFCYDDHIPCPYCPKDMSPRHMWWLLT